MRLLEMIQKGAKELKKMNKGKTLMITMVLVCGLLLPMESKAAENVVIAIDPGHGGTNLGAEPPGFYEKEMTLITANAMQEELEKYEGVTAYLTRNVDQDLSLDDRAINAVSVNADFLFSLHYNMSANQYFYGSEIWAQSTGTNYTKGYSAGQLFLNEFSTNFGTFNRGVKVKLNSKGKEYYGILRAASERGIPAVIVEHCHLDHGADIGFANSADKWKAFGRADATAAAKYFGLKSKVLNVDYSGYPKESIAVKKVPMIQDLTPPEVVTAEVTHQDEANQKLSILMNASDSDSGIMYYSYTTDGGTTWSLLQPWSSTADSMTLELSGAFTSNRVLAVRAYNRYDGMTESVPIAY